MEEAGVNAAADATKERSAMGFIMVIGFILTDRRLILHKKYNTRTLISSVC